MTIYGSIRALHADESVQTRALVSSGRLVLTARRFIAGADQLWSTVPRKMAYRFTGLPSGTYRLYVTVQDSGVVAQPVTGPFSAGMFKHMDITLD